MPEDRTTQTGSASASDGEQAAPPIAHEDIMQRLLEYQRKLREGLSPQEAARAVAESVAGEGAPSTEQAEQGIEPHAEPVITATQPEPVVDLTAAEAELEQRASQEAQLTASEDEDRAQQEAEPAEAEAPAQAAVAAEAPVEAPPPEPAPEAAAEPAAEPAIAPASPGQAEAAAPASGSVWAVPAPSPDPELAARVERLERTLASVSQQVSELRQRFQDMAIAADERLAELERTLSRAGREER
jgi:chemotaxis protein histidine kinase CheA